MTTYELTNTCICENEDGTPSNYCWDCYTEAKTELIHALDNWATALEISHVELIGRAMGWTRSSGSATVEASGDLILDLLTINGEYRLEVELPEGDDLADFTAKAMRYSHDEPTGASFILEGLTTCEDSGCNGECNFNFCEAHTE